MHTPSYDILRKNVDGIAIWLDAVADFEAAKARVLHLAERHPAEYLIFHSVSCKVVANFLFKPSQACPLASLSTLDEKGSSAI